LGQVEVRDHAVWAKHIHGNRELRDEILGLAAGTVIQLKIDGRIGPWVKMNDGAHGKPTDGIRPLGATKAWWAEVYAKKTGELIEIEKA
jgi:hypothetical protein